ncbi:MAG TPA: glycosyltransferase family 39 protein [Caulobacteraceae bacterium]|nr:glycosyltransferase family 39 protein [Caulobacteraceae bacterium]
MTEPTRLDRLARGWRGPLLAALIALAAGLPGLLFTPVIDRDEPRFAQSAAQMLESGDFVDIDFQDALRAKKPVLVYWLQAASVELASSAPARQIWAYRIPSLLGAMLAAAACAWGAEALFGAGSGLIAGAILATSTLLLFDADLATADGVLAGAVTTSMAAFGRLYAASRGELKAGVRTKLLFWLGLALAILDKGPVGPLVALATGVALALWDRRAPWAKSLGWGWGLILVLAFVGPWAMAITVKTDGAFWTGAVGGDLAPKLLGGDDGHAFPPGYHTLLAVLLFFPATALLPAMRIESWRARASTGVRFALAWLVPSWVLFELLPNKLPHYVLPLYGALAWLASFALTRPPDRWSRWAGAGLSLAAGLGIAVLIAIAATLYGGPSTVAPATAAAVLAIAASVAAAAVALRRWGLAALAAAGVAGVAAHATAVAAALPSLSPVWTAQAIVDALQKTGLDPRGGLTPGPVTVVGFTEPSIVFLLGTDTVTSEDVGDAAEAIDEGRPAVVESAYDAAFQSELGQDKLKASPVAYVRGFDYANGHWRRLTIYRSDQPPQMDQTPP